MYYKQSTGAVIVRKSISNASWVKWVHHSQGLNCCQECVRLNGCLFLGSKAPTWPHHPNCHCTLDPVDYSEVLLIATAQCDYSKFDPYLFNTTGLYTHTKEKLFAQWDIRSMMHGGFKLKWNDRVERNIFLGSIHLES